MYVVNLKLIARGNWRNVGVIDYQIGIKRQKILNKIKIIKLCNLAFVFFKASCCGSIRGPTLRLIG